MEVAESPTHSALTHLPSGEPGSAGRGGGEPGLCPLPHTSRGGGGGGEPGLALLLMALPTSQEKEEEEGISQESSEEEQ